MHKKYFSRTLLISSIQGVPFLEFLYGFFVATE